MKKVLFAVAALSMLLFATTAHASLIVNGDFSNGLDGWDVSHAHAVKVENGAAILGHGSSFGSVNSSISQKFYIAPGTESLDISFELNFKGWDYNVLLNDAAFVVLSTLKMEKFLFWDLEKWSNYNIFSWSSKGEYTTLSVNTTVFLSADFSDVNPNAEIAFVLDESFFGMFNWFLSSTMSVSNVSISPTAATPIPGAVWLLGSGLAGLVALRRKVA